MTNFELKASFNKIDKDLDDLLVIALPSQVYLVYKFLRDKSDDFLKKYIDM